jgi:signal transduction histidine kinase
MKQVFMNLILNAIQAMREGGSIFISTRLVARDEAGHSGQFVQVEVRDTGIGIPPENLDRIFDPFFTSKDEVVAWAFHFSSDCPGTWGMSQ